MRDKVTNILYIIEANAITQIELFDVNDSTVLIPNFSITHMVSASKSLLKQN
jgi:hypothetical protein